MSGRFGLFTAVDLEVVDLVEAVRRRVQHGSHQRADQRVDDEPPAPRLARVRRRWPWRRPSAMPSAGANSVNGRANSMYVRRRPLPLIAPPSRPGPPRRPPRVPVLMKFSMSLSSVPEASSVAPRELSTNEPAVAPVATNHSALPLDQPERLPERRESERGHEPGAGALQRHGARRARPHAREGRDEIGRRPQALPTSLATVSLAPAASAVTMASRAPLAYGRQRRPRLPRPRGQAAIRDRVSRAAASAARLGDPEHPLPLEAQPSTSAAARRTTRTASSSPQAPAAPNTAIPMIAPHDGAARGDRARVHHPSAQPAR